MCACGACRHDGKRRRDHSQIKGNHMASASKAGWAEFSDDLARVAEEVGQAVVALQPKEAHAASGVIWQQGIVVTANHAARSDEVAVMLGGGKTAVGRIKGRDPSTDLAIFSVEGEQGTG